MVAMTTEQKCIVYVSVDCYLVYKYHDRPSTNHFPMDLMSELKIKTLAVNYLAYSHKGTTKTYTSNS